MINHAYTLLRNRRGVGVDTGPGAAYTPPSYSPVALPPGLERVRRSLFGVAPDATYLDYRLWQYTALLHSGDYAGYLSALDPRITYWPRRSAPDFGFGVRVATISGDQPLYVFGSAEPDDATGRSEFDWKVEVLSTPLAPLVGAAAPPAAAPRPLAGSALAPFATPAGGRRAALLGVASRVAGKSAGPLVSSNPAAPRSLLGVTSRVARGAAIAPIQSINPARPGALLGASSRLVRGVARSGAPPAAGAAGGVPFGGSAARSWAFRPSPAGGATLGGSAPLFLAWGQDSAGGASAGGSASPTYAFRPPPSGGVAAGGAAGVTSAWIAPAAGGVGLGGAAALGSGLPAQASGGVGLGGSASPGEAHRPGSSGGIGLGGSAPAAYAGRPVASGGVAAGGSTEGGAGRQPEPSGGIGLGGSASPAAALGSPASGGVGFGGSAPEALHVSIPRATPGRLIAPLSRVTSSSARAAGPPTPPSGPGPVHVRITPFRGRDSAFPPIEASASFTDGLSDPIALPGSGLMIRLTPLVEAGDAYEVSYRARPGRGLPAVVADLKADPRNTPVDLFGALPEPPYDTFAALWRDHNQLPEQLTGLLLALIYRTEAYRSP